MLVSVRTSPGYAWGARYSFLTLPTPRSPLLNHLWDFGDGNTSTLPNPVHTYAAAGSYPVQLTVTNANGCTDSLRLSVPLVVSNPPQAQILPQPPGGCAPLSVAFQDSSITTFPIVDWQWDFGDGRQASNLSFVSHTYNTPGTYQVKLKIQDSQGCEDSVVRPLDVTVPPVANFTANNLSGCAPKTIQFTDLSTSNQPIADWFWDFGDGNTSTQRSPRHTYLQNGTFTVSLTVTNQNGCAATEIKSQYIVLQNPISDFVMDATRGCPPIAVNFTATPSSVSPVASFLWDFGDGTTSNLPNPSHTYTLADTYAVSLVIVNGQGCRDTVRYPRAVIAYEKPQADFLRSDSSLCLPGFLQVSNNSRIGSSPIASYRYDFDNGQTAQTPMANTTYSQAGIYDVKLLVRDFNGCVDSVEKKVTTYAGPQANFRANDSLGCGAKSFTFFDLSGGGNVPVSWRWNFGDGSGSIQQQPSHFYSASGNYTVSLKVTDANGCSDSLSRPNYIRLDGPQAAFSFTQTSSCANAAVAFTDNSYADTTLTSWQWDFGDGNTGSGANPSHTYARGGQYPVSLTVTNVQGCASTLLDTVTIVTAAPLAAFNLPDTACAPFSLSLRDRSQPGAAALTAWAWDLDNGNTANTPNPVVNYANQGTYSIRLRVVDANGCVDSLRQSLTVVSPPVAAFLASDSSGCALLPITFTDLSGGSAPLVSHLWEFGNGDTSQQLSPTYTYPQGGTYDVTLTVRDTNGCVSRLRKPDLISMQAPVARFSLDQARGCQGLSITFTDLSQTDTTLVSWLWDFGDSLTSRQQNPVHSYAAPGRYTVSLTIMDATGCGAMEQKVDTIEVFAGPQVDFGLSDTVGCVPLVVNFFDSTSSSQGFGSRQWRFGNLGATSLPNPSRAFTVPGTYPIWLKVTDNQGCSDSARRDLVVFGPPQVDFGATDSQACAATNIQLLDQTQSGANLVSWRWNLGDGTTSAQQFPQHTYTQNGSYSVSLVVEDEFGCKDSLTKFQFISIQPAQADFTLSNASGCTGTNAQFSDLSFGNGGVTNWLWDFGDGTTSTQQHPAHSYTQPGRYTVKLRILDAAGCSDTITKADTIRVFRSPQAEFSLSDTASCAPLSVSFTDLSVPTDAGLASWSWDFGTGNPAFSPNPTNQFVQPGRYAIRLTVTDSNGCPNERVRYLRVYEPPRADFGASDSTGCASKQVSFLDRSTSGGGIVSWQWDFGDGGNASQPFPTHTYLNNGLFDVSLKVSDRFGCEDSVEKRQYIRLVLPMAAFGLSSRTGCTGTPIAFTDQSSSDSSIVSWLWDFGDGTTSTQTNPQHSYTQAGTYAVSLTVTDAKGCAQTETLPQAVVISDGPQVSFGLSDTAGCAPLVVQFSDASSAPAGIAAWRWNFGNGGSAASANPLRAYNQPGAYQVSLTVTDSIGCQASLGQSLHVYAPPLANFSADDTLGCASHITNFLDLSSSQAGLSSWQWDFGDGNGSTQQFPTHTYLNNGTFNVGLTVTDRFGCVAQLTRRQYIRLDAPDAAFGLSRRQGCTGADISFQDLSQTDTSIIGWLWDFGDGTTSLTPNPTHRYIQAGSYTVSLTITDAKGCIDTEVLPQAVRISDGPAVAFTLSDTAGCAPLLVQFNDASSSPTGLRSWQWQLGNGSQAQGPNPSRSYGIPGRYPIRLVVTDSSGCQDSLTQQVRVYAPPSANFGADDSLGCAAKLVNFVDLSSAPAGISSWTWDFGDGGNASQQFPSHTYLNNGSFDVKLKVTDRFGCTDSLIRRKYINLDAPQAAFNLSQRQACNSLNVQFTDLSQADTSLLSWLWDFGDGSTATVPNPSHLYTQPGVYAVSLTIVDAKGCSNTEVLPAAVRISNGPQVDFALSDTAGCAPLGVQFSDLSSSPTGLRSWRWDLGNGSSAAGPGPVRAYQQPGQYLIQLVVTDSSGCQDSLSKSLQVYAPPVANFGADDSVGCANKLVNFSDLSTSQAGITSWTWDFGDGGNANQPFPTYTYQNNGRYDVSLRVTDRFGCTDSLVRRQYIQLSPPQAAFSLSQGQGCQGMQVAFSDLSRSDTSIVSWLWDFGDGSTSGLANPSHRFTQAGQYPVSLTITDAWGCMDTELLPQAVTVSAGPQVAFGLSDTAGCAPLRVSFTDQSSAGQGIRSWAWDMGNGTQATGSSPSRAFSQPGSYTIQLTVTDSAGCQASLSQPLNVYAPPQADFSISDSLGCAPRVVSLLDLSSSQAGLVGWRWDFGNGDSSLQQFPTYVFSQNGNYDVALTVTDRFGCQDQLRKQQLVKLADPVADFSLSQAQGCPGMPVSFIDLSSSDTSIVAWYWDFGDGTFSTQPQPSHTYSSPGRYTVRLQITDAWGCSDSEQKVDTIEIFSLPVAAIGQSVQAGCRPLPVQFADSSQQGSAPITRWAWDLGNQSLSSLSQPQHTYSQAGTYPIRLRVTDANGCADSVTSSLLVHDTPTAAFMAPDTLGCAPDSLAFLDQSSGPAPLVNWQWNFGDGGAGSGPQPSHRYQAAGSYDVSLRIIDQNGCEDSLTRQAYIRLSEPMADFGIDTLTACPGTQVNFRDRSFSDTTLLSWRWDFGDGTVRSNGPTQSHRYAQSGQYVAQLTITDALGCRDSMTAPMAVNVLAPPVAAIQGPQQGCEPLLAQYQAQGQGGNNWQWYLDGQAAGGGSTIAQNFLQADTHQLSLVVIDNLGCRDTASQRVVVHPLPEANFRVLDSLGCAPMPVRFRDLSQGDLAAWLWDFGDGNFSTLNNPIHSYQQDGAYTIRLKVTTVHGCLDSMVQFDQVNMRRPQVDFSIDHDEPCAPLAVDFSAQARFDTGIADWFWVFGDGNSGKGNPIAHSYVDPGIYSVSLIATDSLGCRDTVSYADLLKVKENNILPAPPVHRVTVHSDDRVDIVFRPTSSPDFEHYRIYRETPLGSGQFVQIHQTSFRDDTTFSDYGLNIGGLNCVENVYCYKVTAVNDCGSETELADAPAHCTIELKTRVAPDRMLLNWTPYAGWEVAFYEIYRVGSYDLSSAQLLDMVPGQTLQYVDASARCSNVYTYRIKAVGFGGQQYSWSDTARARNQRTANLEPNEVVRATVESNRFVRVEWLPIQMSDLTTIILERRSLEYPEWTAIELLEPGSNSYRDEQVAVDRESYSYRITARDSCGFLSEVSNLGKSILLKRGPAGAQHLLSWSAYEAWGQGVDYYELEVYNDFSQSWELVDVVPADTLSYDVSAIYLDQPEYCFRVRAHESGGHQAVSLSNQVCLPVEPEIFAPNAFTPNSDGYNDVFYLKGVFISEFQLLIFDRWGRKVFEARDINEAWDGTHKGQAVPEGVYTFIARGIGYNGLKHEIDGTVTVIR
jgi:gliding motility-associated-like protein